MIQTARRNSTRLRQDARRFFFFRSGLALCASGCVSSQEGEPSFIYPCSWIRTKRKKSAAWVTVSGRERKIKIESARKRGSDPTTRNGWNGTLSKTYTCANTTHTHLCGCWHSIIIFFFSYTRFFSLPQCAFGVASFAVNFVRGAMKHSFDFACLLSFSLC